MWHRSLSTLGVPIIADDALEHIKSTVQDIVVVTDDDAFAGVMEFAEIGHVWVEPAAGTLLAGIRQVSNQLSEKAVLGLVVCGGNATHADITDYIHNLAKRVSPVS